MDLLLIDDTPSDVLMVEKLLADSGLDADITVAADLAAARRGLTRRTQCIIVDLSAPGIDDQMAGLREVLEMSGTAAVVVLTGLEDAHLGCGPSPPAPRTTWSSRRWTGRCWRAPSATP